MKHTLFILSYNYTITILNWSTGLYGSLLCRKPL